MIESPFINFLIVLTCGANAFAIIQLIAKGLKHPGARIAIILLVLWTIRFLLIYVKSFDFAYEYPLLLVLDPNLLFLDGVLFWFYAKSIRGELSITWKSFLHFIPFAFMMGVTLFMLFENSTEEVVANYLEEAERLKNLDRSLSSGTIIPIIALIIWTLSYVALSIRELKKFNSEIYRQFSNISSIRADWLIQFHWAWIILFIFPTVLYFAFYLFSIASVIYIGVVMAFALMGLSLVFSYKVIHQDYTQLSIASEESKYDQLNTEELKADAKRLVSVIEEEQLFKNDQLSLQDLSDAMHLKPSLITELIKLTDYNNFYDLINSYRIEGVKKDLSQSNEQIIILAFENGFNSKSAFNKLFKEKTGFTPTEYRKQISASDK